MKTKLLFICSMNIDRSPAGEAMLKNSSKYETKSAGLEPVATKLVTQEDVLWADIIFVMDERNEGHKTELIGRFSRFKQMDVRVLGIPSYFHRYDPELYRLLRVRLEKEGIDVEETSYEDFAEGYETKKEIELLVGEEIDNKIKNTLVNQGEETTYISRYITELFDREINKNTKEGEDREKNGRI